VAAFRLPDMAHLGALNVTGLLTCALLQGLRTASLRRSELCVLPALNGQFGPEPTRAMLPQTGYQGCQIPEDITGSNCTAFPRLRKCVALWGRLATRTLGQSVHFVAVEAMPPYSKRTDNHGGIERVIILKQMNRAAAGCYEACE
jgi:hypothetical protein